MPAELEMRIPERPAREQSMMLRVADLEFTILSLRNDLRSLDLGLGGLSRVCYCRKLVQGACADPDCRKHGGADGVPQTTVRPSVSKSRKDKRGR